MWPVHSAQNYSFHLPTNLFLYPIIRDQRSRLFFFFFMLIQLPINQIASYPNFILRLPVRQSPDSETYETKPGGPQQKSQVPFSIKEDCLKQFIKAYNFCFNSLALHGIPHRSTAVHPSARGKEYHHAISAVLSNARFLKKK